MDIEGEAFARRHPDFEKMLACGFRQDGEAYRYAGTFMDGDFRAELTVSPDGAVRGVVIDTALEEAYTYIHADFQNGAFVNTVRDAYRAFLADIAARCWIADPFATAQANRIAARILALYGERPDFPFARDSTSGAFRNPQNKKWYALVMHIDRGKLGAGTGMTDVMNLKSDRLPELTRRRGIYPSYHMNKSKWITVLLDDTLSDAEILDLIAESRAFTLGKRAAAAGAHGREWLIPANFYYYDVARGFRESPDGVMTWKQGAGMAAGDFVYMYMSAPVSAVLYLCAVVETDLPRPDGDAENSQKEMKIQLLKIYESNRFPLCKLKEYGVNTVRGPRYVPDALSRALRADGTWTRSTPRIE